VISDCSWELVKELPLTELPNLIEQSRKREIEQRLYQRWSLQATIAQLLNAAAGAFGGGEILEVKPFAEVLQGVFQGDAPSVQAPKKSAEEIQAEAMAAVKRYEKFARGKGGDA